jgi:dihydroorotate dehydrogenase
MFLLDAEQAHYFTVAIFRWLLKIPILNKMVIAYFQVKDPNIGKTVFGLNFKSPVGLAAGFDKDGKSFDIMSVLGFGFIEIGTVTPLGQNGNDKPRLFRLKNDRALINRMGFNNEGVDALVTRLKNRKQGSLIIGGNIGKNKETPNEKAIEDYITCYEKLYEYVDYFVINVSSPNTPGLRELQEKEPLTALLRSISAINKAKPHPKPILLKIAPDLSHPQLDDIFEIVTQVGINGIVATNTTLSRSNLTEDYTKIGAGGLSGKPLYQMSLDVIKYLHQKSNGTIPIIGVGGIDQPQKAQEMLNAGACLIQVYSGLVYEGPTLVKKINQSFKSS